MGSRDTVAGRPGESVAQLNMVPETQLSNKRDTAPPTSSESKWNTKNLALRLAADFASASSAAALVAPLISIIDKYVAMDRFFGFFSPSCPRRPPQDPQCHAHTH